MTPVSYRCSTPQYGAPNRIRTDTVRILSPLSLPVGLLEHVSFSTAVRLCPSPFMNWRVNALVIGSALMHPGTSICFIGATRKDVGYLQMNHLAISPKLDSNQHISAISRSFLLIELLSDECRLLWQDVRTD